MLPAAKLDNCPEAVSTPWKYQEIDQALDLLPASKVHVACCAEMRQCRKRDDALEGKSNLTESSRDTNDETLALEELGDGDLVAGGVLHQLNVRNRIADLNHDGS